MALEALERQSALQNAQLQKLRLEWAAFAGFCLLFLGGGFALITLTWQPTLALLWLPLPVLVVGYLLRVLWQNLDANHREGEQRLLPDLGWGNRLTLLRGVLVAGMMGFILLPRPEGWLAWIPGILYTLADAADFFDGYVARVTRRATRLGNILDMSFDGLGVLAASVLVVLYGQAPLWYLLVGSARYLFIAGERLRRRLGKPVYPMPPSFNRRVFAGLQMGFLAVALWPIITPPGIHFAAALFGAPLLLGFGRDWLYVSGVLRDGPSRQRGWQTRISKWLPLGLRLLILALNVGYFMRWLAALPTASPAFGLIGLLNWLAVGMLVLGILPRVASIAALLALGLAQMLSPLTPVQILLGVVYTLILYMGSGAFSLWTPEDYLYRHYAGQRQSRSAVE